MNHSGKIVRFHHDTIIPPKYLSLPKYHSQIYQAVKFERGCIHIASHAAMFDIYWLVKGSAYILWQQYHPHLTQIQQHTGWIVTRI